MKRKEVLEWIKSKGDDIVLIQESHSVCETENLWKRDWGTGTGYFNHGSSNSLGTVFLIQNRNVKVTNFNIIVQGRASLLELSYEDQDFCVVNFYGPNTDNTDCIEKVLHETFGRTRNDYIILAGDWNTVLNNDLDKMGGALVHSNKKCQILLNTAMGELGLHDPFRLENQQERTFTHFNKKCKTASRLDFFLVDNNTVNLPICTSTITHGFKSDHSYVQLTLQGSSITHGRGYWKLNNSLLENDEYCEGVRDIISGTQAESYDSLAGLWDVIKFKVKDHSIRSGKKFKKIRNERKITLENKIQEIKNDIKIFQDQSDHIKVAECYENLNSSQHQLNAIVSEEVKGIITRSRIQWVEQGERSTKYFLGLEKASQKKKSLTKLISESSTILTNQQDISDHVVGFYQHLFTSTHPNTKGVADYLKDSKLDEISDDMSSDLDLPIGPEELDIVVKSLKNNKSPGWDGLTSEFYKTFWVLLKPLLFKVYNQAIVDTVLPQSLRIGVITLIPKPKPPPELNFIKNWRPITLLNNDYKILTHVIKNRILKAVPKIISKAQSGFQAGRSTSDNLILMYLVLEHYNNNPDEEGLLLQVDYEKAFDTVEHEFVFQAMKAMGFGQYLISLVKLVYHGCLSYANVNGHLSDTIYIGRGLHQGSPLSPILFLITAQVFTKRLEDNTEVKGISIDFCKLLQSLFADDTDLFLAASEQTISAVFRELSTFGVHSGCKFNPSKTKCIPLGKARFNSDLTSKLKDTYGTAFIPDNHLFTALGINFHGNDINSVTESNYTSKLNKAMSLAKIWGARDMTVYGRITLIKSFLLSQFVYLIVPLPKPNSTLINSVNRLIYNFMWGGGMDKIKREIVDRPKSSGGLDMVNFDNFLLGLKVKLIFKLLDKNFAHPWKDIVLSQLKFPQHLNISIEVGAAKKHRKFTQDLLDSFREWKIRVANCRGKTINECIWGNSIITGKGNTLWNAALINRRVAYLSDFVNADGEILSYVEFRYKHNVRPCNFSKSDYVNIKLAIRRYNNPNNCHKSLGNIDTSISLDLFYGGENTPHNVPSKMIRQRLMTLPDPATLPALRGWCSQLSQLPQTVKINWCQTFQKLYKATNNYKLIQHQYKVFMQIATCKYMRHKMKIANTYRCSSCSLNAPETLAHIYIHCPKTLSFYLQLNNYIRNGLDPQYIATDKYFTHFTCGHTNAGVNFLNLVACWYIGRKFQWGKDFFWDEFIKFVNQFLIGEKTHIKECLADLLSLQ